MPCDRGEEQKQGDVLGGSYRKCCVKMKAVVGKMGQELEHPHFPTPPKKNPKSSSPFSFLLWPCYLPAPASLSPVFWTCPLLLTLNTNSFSSCPLLQLLHYS